MPALQALASLKTYSMQHAEQLKKIVKEKYGEIATRAGQSCCSCSCECSPSGEPSLLRRDYAEVDGYDPNADLNLGCGIPTKFANISAGDVVLDLGAGAGNDVFVARRLVGTHGRVIGVDMTETMLIQARQNQERLGYQNVEFRLGDIETLPLEDAEIDVVISNCVLNLVPDKKKAFAEMFRVLKPGGHFCVSDIVLQGELPAQLKSIAELYAGCITGAIDVTAYLHLLQQAGFIHVTIKKQDRITLPDEQLLQYLTPGEVASYRRSGHGIFSVTLIGNKPGM